MRGMPASVTMYLSKSALHEPMSVPTMTNPTHLLPLKLMPSRLPATLKSMKKQSVTTSPTHCVALGLSPKMMSAPMSVQIGAVARMGDTMLSGRFFSP